LNLDQRPSTVNHLVEWQRCERETLVRLKAGRAAVEAAKIAVHRRIPTVLTILEAQMRHSPQKRGEIFGIE